MANIQSQEKRNRQNEKRRQRNVQTRSSVRTASRKINRALDVKDAKTGDDIKVLEKSFIKTIDMAAQKGVIHKKTAARKKSRLAKKVNEQLKKQA